MGILQFVLIVSGASAVALMVALPFIWVAERRRMRSLREYEERMAARRIRIRG